MAALHRSAPALALACSLTVASSSSRAAPDAAAAPVDAPAAAVTLPELLQPSDPVYPEAARQAGLEATVVLRLDLDAEGRVTQAEVTEPVGHGFDEAAVRAAQGLRFTPATRGGRAIPARILFHYVFALERAEAAALSAVAGDVRSTERLPLARAEVELFRDGRRAARTVTDAAGHFQLQDIEPGRYELRIASPGFSDAVAPVELVSGREAVVAPLLEPHVPAGAALEVTVHGERAPAAVTYRKLARRELARVAGNRGDALAALENLPGMARPPALSGLLIVRGTAPHSTQIFVDGTYVPNMYHFGGLTSVVPTDMLDHVDFFTGNYGARFGRGMGGVVDIGVRRPREQASGLVQLDLLDARIQAEGPLPGAQGWRFLAGVRRSHVDTWLIPLLSSQDTSFQAAPVYYDYQAFVEAPSGDGSSLRFGVFGSDDRVRLTNTASQNGGQLDQATAFWNVQTLHEAELSRSVRLRTVASFGHYRERVSVSTLRSDIEAYPMILRSDASARLGDALTLDVGIDLLYAPIRVDYAVPEDTGPGTPEPGSFLLRPPRIGRDGAAYFRPGAYAALQTQLGEGLTVTPGLRLDYTEDTRRWDVSPRLIAKQRLSAGEYSTALEGGIGYFHEPPQIRETLDGYGSQALRSSRALQASLGVEQRLGGPLELTLEGFAIDLDRLVTRRPDAGGRLEYDNSAAGRVVGGELLLRYDADERFFGWLSYTLSRSRRTWGESEPEIFFDFDQTHVLAAVGSYRLGAGWELGARLRWVSGNPLTPCVSGLFSSFDSRYLCVNGPFQGERAKAFFQLDLRAEKAFRLSDDLKLVTYLEIINATAREGEDDRAYSYDYSESAGVSGNLPLLPNLGVRGEFR